MESSAYGHEGSGVGFGAQGQTGRKPQELLLEEMRGQQAQVCEKSAQLAFNNQVITALTRSDILSEMTTIYDALREALETGSNESLARCVVGLNERLGERDVATDEVLGMFTTLRDNVSAAITSTYQREYELLREVSGVFETVANRLTTMLTAGFQAKRHEAEYEVWRQASEMLDESSDCVITVDLQGQILFINKSGRRLLGLGETDNVTTMALPDIYPERESSVISEQTVPTAMREDAWRGESAIVNREGVEIVVAMAIQAHHRPDDTVDFLTITAHEPRERGRGEPGRNPTFAAPMLRISEEILLAPFAGEHDAEALKQFAERLLREIRDLHATAAIIEFTGVSEIDASMASWLPEISAAARLLGAKLIISGVSARAAQSLAGLGMDLHALTTAPDLEAALEQAQRAGGYRLIEIESEAA